MTDDKPRVTIYTDGGASPNPGPGGWGAILLTDQDGKLHKRELSGGNGHTTNNRMELTAAIEALRTLKKTCAVEFYTDSQYLRRGITEWMAKWQRTNFNNGRIENVDLWQQLNVEVARHDIHWNWLKGHAGNQYNERADQLATAARPAQPIAQRPDVATKAFLRISCLGAPGVGAWAALVLHDDTDTILTGGHPKTNANRLDLLAAIAALEAIPVAETAHVFTPNSYLRDGITQWIAGWKKNNWQKKTGGEVQYRDLWQRLDRLNQERRITWIVVSKDAPPPEMARLESPLQKALDSAKQMKIPPDEPV